MTALSGWARSAFPAPAAMAAAAVACEYPALVSCVPGHRMDIQEISDRLEINNLLIDYCSAIDSHDWDALESVFTPDAHIDYTALGGIKGSLPEIKAYLAKVLPYFPSTQHLIANSRVWIDGDSARARTMCHNPMEMPLKAGGTQIVFYGLWYVDRLVRTPAGWRIAERVEENGYAFNVPAEFKPFSE